MDFKNKTIQEEEKRLLLEAIAMSIREADANVPKKTTSTISGVFFDPMQGMINDIPELDLSVPRILATEQISAASTPSFVKCCANCGKLDHDTRNCTKPGRATYERNAIFLAKQKKKDDDTMASALAMPKVQDSGNTFANIMARSLSISSMHQAAFKGDVAEIEKLHAEGLNLSEVDAQGKIPLHYASSSGHTNAIQKLFELGSHDVNIRDKDLWTPLHLAAQNGHEKAVEMLFLLGADETARNNLNQTPFDMAKANGKGALVKNWDEIKRRGVSSVGESSLDYYEGKAEGDIKKDDRETKFNFLKAFHYLPPNSTSMDKFGEELTRIFQESIDERKRNDSEGEGKDKGEKEEENEMGELKEVEREEEKENVGGGRKSDEPLKRLKNEEQEELDLKMMKICSNVTDDHISLERYFKKGGNLNAKSINGNETLAHICCISGNDRCLKVLIKNNADVDLPCDDILKRPSHIAAERMNRECLELLIDSGKIDINALESGGRSIAHYVCYNGDEPSLKYLIKNNANMHIITAEGWTNLHESAMEGDSETEYGEENGRIKLISLLLDAGIDIDAGNDGFMTASMIASYYNNVHFLAHLIHAGADLTLLNNRGLTALDIAREKGHEEIVDLITHYQFSKDVSKWMVNLKANDFEEEDYEEEDEKDDVLRTCEGNHPVFGERGCRNEDCRNRKFCVPSCKGCPDRKLILATKEEFRYYVSRCLGNHNVDGEGGCHNGECRGKEFCTPDCKNCPDMIAARNAINNESGEKPMRKSNTDIREDIILSMDKAWHIGGGSFLPPPIPYSFLTEWTDNFSQVIGNGGFGTVSRGMYYDGKRVRKIAIKRMHNNPDKLREIRRSFGIEIGVLTNIRHISLVRLLGFSIPTLDTDANDPFCLVYEYVEKGDLSQILNDDFEASKLNWKTRINIAYEIANALCYLHNRRDDEGNPCFHRDIKAANVGITWNNKAKLLDMGLAKMKKRETDLTISQLSSGNSTSNISAMVGTPYYLDVDYIQVHGAYDIPCEIYSFGILLCELLFGIVQGTKIDDKTTLLQKNVRMIKNRAADKRAGKDWKIDCQNSIRNLIVSCVDPDWEENRPKSMSMIVGELKRIINEFCVFDILENISLVEKKEIQEKLDLYELSRKDGKDYSIPSNFLICSICNESTECILSCKDHCYCFPCFEDEIQRQSDEDYREYFLSHDKQIVCPLCLQTPCKECKTTCIHNIFKFDVGFFAKKVNPKVLKLFIKANKKDNKIRKSNNEMEEGFEAQEVLIKMPKNDKIIELFYILDKVRIAAVNASIGNFRLDFNTIISNFEMLLKEIVHHFISRKEMEEKNFHGGTATIGACVYVLNKSNRMPSFIREIADEITAQRNRYSHDSGLVEIISVHYLNDNLLPKMFEVLSYYFNVYEDDGGKVVKSVRGTEMKASSSELP